MSQPLTAERFEKFEQRFEHFVDLYAENHGAIITRLDKIDTTLDDHTKRLERIENILWDGQRVAEIERRLIELAETVGRPDLATPITRPIGS